MSFAGRLYGAPDASLAEIGCALNRSRKQGAKKDVTLSLSTICTMRWEQTDMKENTRLDSMLDSHDLDKLGRDPTISAFWRGQVERAKRKALKRIPAERVKVSDVIKFLAGEAYGFRKLADGRTSENDKCLIRMIEASKLYVKTPPTSLGRHINSVRKTGLFARLGAAQKEHLASLVYLRQEGLLQEYVEFMRPLGIQSDMSTARHFYYARVVKSLRRDHLKAAKVNILEIGAGAGNLAIFLMSSGIVANYVICDLQEMLLGAAVQLRDHCPKVNVYFDETPNLEVQEGDCPNVYLLTTSAVEKIESSCFHIALNFNSFMEMDESVRDFYISEIYRTAMHGAVFYNVNRRQSKLPQADGTFFDNNPLLYPYETSDHIIFWEDDPFQTSVRARHFHRPSLAIARAAIVKKESYSKTPYQSFHE